MSDTRVEGGVVLADLWYPRLNEAGCTRSVKIALVDVRAARDIVVTYDFDRNGFVVSALDVCDGPSIEQAFISGEYRRQS